MLKCIKQRLSGGMPPKYTISHLVSDQIDSSREKKVKARKRERGRERERKTYANSWRQCSMSTFSPPNTKKATLVQRFNIRGGGVRGKPTSEDIILSAPRENPAPRAV